MPCDFPPRPWPTMANVSREFVDISFCILLRTSTIYHLWSRKLPCPPALPPHPAMSSSLKLFQISDAVGAEERGGGLWSCRTEILAFIFLFMIVHIHLLRAWCYLKSRSQTSFQLEKKSVTQSRWLSIILNHPLHWVNVLLKLLSKLS